MIKKYNNFINEEAPINVHNYSGSRAHFTTNSKKVVIFSDQNKKELRNIGFDHITDHYAVMNEGDYLIKATIITGTYDSKPWLKEIKVTIYFVDEKGQAKPFDSKQFQLDGKKVMGERVDRPGYNPYTPMEDYIGLIKELTTQNILKYLIDTIPTMGLHDNSKHEINFDNDVKESIKSFTMMNEEAPINMDVYRGGKEGKEVRFSKQNKNSLKTIGFDYITDYYAIMNEGEYLIKATTRVGHMWGKTAYLNGVKVSIYFTDDKTGQVTLYDSKDITISGEEGDGINEYYGIIDDEDIQDIMKYIIDTIPTMGMHDNSQHGLNLDSNVKESIKTFTMMNEEAPVNMEFYNRQEDLPLFNDEQQSALRSIGFENTTKHYATMMEGDYLIKALPEIASSNQGANTWLKSVNLKIYSIDNNGKTEFFTKKDILVYTPTEGDWLTYPLINNSGRLNGSPGLISNLVKKNIIKFIVDTIPTMGLHTNIELNIDNDVKESIKKFSDFND